jgi:hypothetical protein
MHPIFHGEPLVQQAVESLGSFKGMPAARVLASLAPQDMQHQEALRGRRGLPLLQLGYFAFDMGATEWRAGPPPPPGKQPRQGAAPAQEPAPQFPIQVT